MILLLILGTLILCALLIGLGDVIGKRRSSLSRSDREELIILRRTVAQLDRLSYDSRDVYPEVSFQITDIIRTSKNERELP